MTELKLSKQMTDVGITLEDLAGLGITTQEEFDVFLADGESIKMNATAALMEQEDKMESAVHAAHQYINDQPDDRVMALAHYYGDSVDEVGDTTQLDSSTLFNLVCILAFRLAEAQQQIAALSDGNRRRGKR
jgi:hypothetical protein